MLRSIYLVARRDYLGYVTAWGFWLGLMITPILFGLGMIVPSLAASSTPTRHFTVIDPNGAFERAVEAEMAERRFDAARGLVEASEFLGQDEEAALARFDAAVEAGADPQAALDAAFEGGAPLTLPAESVALVDPPARTIEELRPWLSGERQIDTPDGPVPLFAALVVTDDGIEYWSESVSGTPIQSIARQAARAMAQDQVFSAQGVDPSILETIRAATPDFIEKRLREDPAAASEVTLADRAPFYVAVALSFVLWTLIFSVVNYLLMGTIEERSNKIFDTLLTSVKLPHLLAGKLIAVLAVSLTLTSVWSIGGTLMTALVGQVLPAEASGAIATIAGAALNPALLLPAILSFLLGYLMYGSIFLALGSLCDTIQEAQTLMTPLLVLLMVPLFMAIIAMNDPESPILAVMSWVPLFTPFLLILRMPTEPPLWEVLGQLGLMVATTLAILWIAAQVYRAGAVHGAGVNDALGWMKRLGRKPKAA